MLPGSKHIDKNVLIFGCLVLGVLCYVATLGGRYYAYERVDNFETTYKSLEEQNGLDASKHEGCEETRSPARGDSRYRRKAVIVIAVMRSGSSFLGDFFNQNPGVYYLFEPLHAVGSFQNATRARKEILHDLLKCDYSRIPELYKNSRSDKFARCKNNICFEGRSKFLWRNTDLCQRKPPLCGGYLDPEVLTRVCHQSIFPAIKVINMPLLRELEPILTDPELDLKIIQLVRDPRAIVSSRIANKQLFSTPESIIYSTKTLCNSFHINSLYADNCIFKNQKKGEKDSAHDNLYNDGACNSSTHNLWKGHFMRISHEYMSENPFEAMSELYDFVGLNQDSSVLDWLENSTGVTRPQKIRRAKRAVAKNYYRTSRNSTAVLNAWRSLRDFETINSIQLACASAMTNLGYSVVSNPEELNDISRKLYDFKKALRLPQVT